MTLLDLCIILVVVASILQGLRYGFLSAAASLLGFIAGLLVAGRYWYTVLPAVRLFLSIEWAADLVSFFVVALLTILVFTLVGHVLQRMAHRVGLGWLDRILGGAFGLLRGMLVVVLGFIIVAAFLPTGQWTRNSRFAPFFLSAAQSVTRTTPSAAEKRLHQGLEQMQHQMHSWLPQTVTGK